ncbi:hypothetical protein [Flavivirga eckloniae]|uniref:Uncharacterized protein n=1 Tax=Flavivirga eckloniae TaxID=1803846 RepID=A0A2K9PSI6_9FLAO|nr:hypothetical protein [Flavivirga eckloniae]AUP79778.1 hypothetical protein C1H87_14120 [Flavivirga eckloniae]
MGSFVEINDTLQLTEEQGFPVHIFDLEKHQKNPVTLKDVEGKVFEFKNKPSARLFQIDPVRVYYVHNVNGKWLFWGRVLIQSQKIEKQLNDDGTWDGESWKTSGTYTILNVYDPEYQKTFTLNEAPDDRNYYK